MALSQNFFSIRHGSTKSATFSEYRGAQITKERVLGGKGNAAQAKRFTDMAKAFQVFKGMISRSDFFREAQKVEVLKYTEDGFPIAPWPCAWGSGQCVSITQFQNFHFSVSGLYSGWITSNDVPYYLFDSLSTVDRFHLLPLLDANIALHEMSLIFDFWYQSSGMIRHASSSCRVSFGSSDMNANLIEPSGFVDANEQSLYIGSPFSSRERISFYAWYEPDVIPLRVMMNNPNASVLMLAVRSVIDGRLSKSFCYVP